MSDKSEEWASVWRRRAELERQAADLAISTSARGDHLDNALHFDWLARQEVAELRSDEVRV
jgi:hypothetical protein